MIVEDIIAPICHILKFYVDFLFKALFFFFLSNCKFFNIFNKMCKITYFLVRLCCISDQKHDSLK